MKPLFIPLKAEYYDQFANKTKGYELRLEGPRWNDRTCIIGRPVVLSRGYGKAHRLKGKITQTYSILRCSNPDFVKLFGTGKTARIIYIEQR